MTLSDEVKGMALALGFDLVGVTDAVPRPETEFLREWIARGFAGEMGYIERRVEQRVDPRLVVPDARSVIVVGLVYDPGGQIDESGPRVARYAGGDDYHDVMIDRLRALESALEARVEAPIKSRCYVDTGPVQERVFAAYAGLGWIGKNTCLIHTQLGSYLFLGVLITDLPLDRDLREPDHCGSCRACIDACPTDALIEPYVLDATRCISYTTIEARGPVPEPLREAHGGWIFGCDICQEVCPWNTRERRTVPPDPMGLRERISARPEWLQPSLAWLLDLDEERWRHATKKTALRRTQYRGLMRNVLVAAGNSRDPSLRDAVARHADSPDELIAEHARWAIARLAKH